MPEVKDAYHTTKERIVVRDTKNNVWVVRKEWLSDLMSDEVKLEKAIDLFTTGKLDAFEKYDEKIHGLLHI